MNKANRRPRFWLVLCASVVPALVACSSDSLWIDEAWVGLLAAEDSLSGWWRRLREISGSTLQMPLYTFYIWMWEKFAGHSEWALRVANVPWFCLGQYALVLALRNRQHAPWVALFLGAANPFLWFYLNEARPYIMQYAAAAIVCAVLFRAAEDPSFGTRPGAIWAFCGGVIILCASSLLGVLWAAFAGVAWWYLVLDHFGELRRTNNLLALMLTAAALAALAIYYQWTISMGARASAIGRTGPWNALYVAYELLVLAGLGPGRLQIREHGLTAFTDLRGILLPLTGAAILFLGLIVYAARITPQSHYRRATIAGCFYAIPPTLLLFALGFVQNFRVLGRHLTPLLPVIIGLFTLALANLWFRRWRIGAPVFAALVALWLASAMSLRFGERHRKDDYRGAAAEARVALSQGKVVWWAADRAGAEYYGLPSGRTGLVLLANPISSNLATLGQPDVVLLSKPDIYDANGALAAFLAAENYRTEKTLPAFTVWQRQ